MFTEKNKKINRLTLKHVLFLITYTIALIWIMLHLNEVFDTVSMIIGMLRPFIYGIMMAFVFNIPMKFFLKKLPDNLGRWKKALAAVCSMLIIFGILAFIVRIVMPQVIESIADCFTLFQQTLCFCDPNGLQITIWRNTNLSGEQTQQLIAAHLANL